MTITSYRVHHARGLALIELLLIVVALTLFVSVLFPLLGAGRSHSRERASLVNLNRLALAHAAYAADWSDKQFTHAPENMGQAPDYDDYVRQFGCPPSIVLGYGTSLVNPGPPGTWAYWMPCEASVGVASNFQRLWPFDFENDGSGMYELCNVVGFNEYVGGRFMDPTFYAPADRWRLSVIGPGLESEHPFTFTGGAGEPWKSSYILSPPAMYHPHVFGGGPSGTFVSPYGFASSMATPTVSQCAHPALKSRMVEKSWLQSPPIEHNAFFSYPIPFYFNQGTASVPMTLFFDGHTGPMPIRQVLADNKAVVAGGGPKLWLDGDEISDGDWAAYLGFFSAAAFDADAETSVHVFTRGGILGRDLLTAGP